MHETDAGTWLNDQMQLNQVMDLIKVLYEPQTAAACLPACSWSSSVLNMLSVLFYFFGAEWREQSEQNSKKLFDLMLSDNRALTGLHSMHSVHWLNWLESELNGKKTRAT